MSAPSKPFIHFLGACELQNMVATMAGLAPVTDESSVDPVVRAALSHTEQPPLSPVTAAFERGVVPAFERVAPPAPTEVRRGEGLGLRVD